MISELPRLCYDFVSINHLFFTYLNNILDPPPLNSEWYPCLQGLEYFGYDSETWVDASTFNREQNVSLISKLNKTNSQNVR